MMIMMVIPSNDDNSNNDKYTEHDNGNGNKDMLITVIMIGIVMIE